MPRPFGDVARRLLPHASGFAFGLLLVGYASATYATYAYMRATPSVGAISTSTGFRLSTLVLFVVGVMVAFLAAGGALYRIREDTS